MILTILIKEKENPCDDPTENKNWFLTEFFSIQVWGHKFQQLNKAIHETEFLYYDTLHNGTCLENLPVKNK